MYESTNLWMIQNDMNQNNVSPDFIEYISIPPRTLDFFFITGHNYKIKEYLQTHYIQEKNIVAITCNVNANFQNLRLKRKRFYIANQNSLGYAPLLIGSEYGFSFNLTESEILFYNTPKSSPLIKRLDKSFTLIRSF
jgi:hypothetical protein